MKLFLTVAVFLASALAESSVFFLNKNLKKAMLVTPGTKVSGVTGSLEKTSEGWYYLEMKTDSAANTLDEKVEQMSLMGKLEGEKTCDLIRTFYPNFYFETFGSDLPTPEVLDFMQVNYDYMAAKSDELASTSEYWATVKGIVAQLNGVLDGYAASECGQAVAGNEEDISNLTTSPLTLMHMLLMNAWGDLYTIQTKFMLANTTRTSDGRFSSSFEEAKLLYTEMNGFGGKSRRIKHPHTEIPVDLRCSSLFKLLPDNSDVFFGHTTWDSFVASGPRIIKRYAVPMFSATAERGAVRDIYMSSGAALLSSVDDYYTMMDSKSVFAVIETTNDVLNPDLFELVVPESVLSWARVTTSNMLATDGNSWGETFSVEASGTYTNQWQVADFNKFVAGSAPEAGFFTVVEEIPGKVRFEDLTEFVNTNKNWPSYNVPYFDDIYEESGNAAACRAGTRTGSVDFCYDTCSRAQIFAEKQAEVGNMDDMKYLINYNDYENEPLSEGDPCHTMACRGDLKTGGYPSGGIDGKVSSAVTIQQAAKNRDQNLPVMHARMGPTHDQVPVFCWSDQKGNYVHEGQPDCFDYEWMAFPPA